MQGQLGPFTNNINRIGAVLIDRLAGHPFKGVAFLVHATLIPYPSAGGRLFGIGGMIEGWGFDFGW